MVNEELVVYKKQLSRFCHDHANTTASIGGYLAALTIKCEKNELDIVYTKETVVALQRILKLNQELIDSLYKEIHDNSKKLEEG
jgi:hypothetical protein